MQQQLPRAKHAAHCKAATSQGWFPAKAATSQGLFPAKAAMSQGWLPVAEYSEFIAIASKSVKKDEIAAMTDSIANSVMQIMPHVNDANSIEIAAMQIMPHVNDAN